MLQDSETTTEYPIARRGLDGLAQIGPSKFDLLGLRFITDNEGSAGAGAEDSADDDGADDQDTDDDQDADTDAEQDSDDEEDGFEGEFDPKRARALITKLRGKINAAKAAKTPKDSPDTAKTQAENLRLRVALRTGLDEDLADRLRGNTEEELIADAEKLVARLSPGEKKLEDRTPKPRLRGGSTPEKDPELSSDEVAKLILGR